MTDKIYLTMKDGSEVEEQFFFEQKNIAIGRTATENDLILNDPSVSDKHACINCREGQFFLQDLDSTNGTFLKGVRLEKDEKVMLNENDQFEIGRMAIKFSRIPDQKADKKDNPDDQPVEAAGKQDGNKKRKRLLIMAVTLLCIFVVIKIYSKPSQPVQKKAPRPSDLSKQPIPLPAPNDYGLTRKGDKSHPDKAVFSFIAESRRVNLHYSGGGIDSKGEVVILLNGTKIADVPLAIKRWQDGLVLPLQRKLIIKGKNQLVFDNVKNPPGSEKWAVRKLSVQFLPQEPCDEIESNRFLDIADNLYNERKISMGNTFKASQYYRKALSKAEGCRSEQHLLNKTEKRLAEILKKLDILYDGYILAFKKSANLKKFKEATDALRAIKKTFPDEKDYRNKEAKRLFKKLENYLNRKKK